MSKAWCVVRGLAALILVALLVIGGIAIHRIGWSQGYIVGQLAARGDQGMAVPYGFGPMGILLAFGLLFLPRTHAEPPPSASEQENDE